MREAQKVDLPAPAGPCGAQSVSVVRRVDKTGDLRNPTITRVPYLLMAGGWRACWRVGGLGKFWAGGRARAG